VVKKYNKGILTSKYAVSLVVYDFANNCYDVGGG
jgi:hypothetical protein